MTHKADSSFFSAKRPWSERKDLFLKCYLKPYLWKVATQKKPILLVDGFAGPGQFDDGKEGSPVILCSAANQARSEGLSVPVKVLCVEKDQSLFGKLRERVGSFDQTTVLNSDFQSVLADIELQARTHSVFLYLDPFTVTGLKLSALDSVLKWVSAGSSVELLLNFSGTALSRIGCSLLAIDAAEAADDDEPQLLGSESAGADDLTEVLGGNWWRDVIVSPKPFAEKVSDLTNGYCDKLKTRLSQVGWHDIRAKSKHSLPKYTMVFGSRHPDALLLMNDAAVQSRGTLAEEEAPSASLLFEMRSESLVPNVDKLPPLVLGVLTGRLSRKALGAKFVREHFGVYSISQINKAISKLITDGKVQSSTGKSRINDDVELWRVP